MYASTTSRLLRRDAARARKLGRWRQSLSLSLQRRYSAGAPGATAAPAPPPEGQAEAATATGLGAWNQYISVSTEPQDEPPILDNDASSPSPSSSDPIPQHPFRLAVKDNIATLGADGAPTTCASRILAGYASPFEATVVTQLRRRGARLIAKTNLDEFGMGSHSTHSAFGGVHARPQQHSSSSEEKEEAVPLSVGGSSGGSAVAVRLGEAEVALGTDTGGSVRLPAAYGGVVGYKPSYGMVSRFGVVPYANSLDTVGLLARGVAPVRRLVVGTDGLWREHDPRDPTSVSAAARLRFARQRDGYDDSDSSSDGITAEAARAHIRGLTFGVPLEYNIEELDPYIRAAWAAAAEALAALGARVAPVSLPSTRHALSAYYVIAPAEASSNLAKYDGVRYGRRSGDDTAAADGAGDVLYERTRGEGFGAEVQERILLGSYTLSSEAMDNYFLQAQRVRRLVVRDFDRAFALANPLRDEDADEAFDLSDLPADVPLASKRGPAQADFLLCPTAPTLAPAVADVDVEAARSPVDAYMNDVFTVPASLAGLPAVSIPVPPPRSTDGSGASAQSAACPGLQLIGQYWDDARLLRTAEAVMELAFARDEDRRALAAYRSKGVR